MKIGDIKIWPVKNNLKIMSNGLVTLDDVLNVKFTIFTGRDEPFVSFPGKYGDKVNPETGKKPWYPDVTFPNTDEGNEFRANLSKAIIDAYNKVANVETNQDEPAGPTNQDNTCPF